MKYSTRQEATAKVLTSLLDGIRDDSITVQEIEQHLETMPFQTVNSPWVQRVPLYSEIRIRFTEKRRPNYCDVRGCNCEARHRG